MEFPNIYTPFLDLREIQIAHKHDLFEIFSDKQVVRYYDVAAFTHPDQCDKLITLFHDRFRSDLGIRWGIFPKGGNKCIGTCGFNSWSVPMRSATIGYELNSSYWGNGITTEALSEIIRQAFDGNLACNIINRIQADTIPGNTASERVLQKLGFKEEGIRRQSGYWKGQYHDLKCFGLLKAEFNSVE